jgi:cytoskeletal protein RodZ
MESVGQKLRAIRLQRGLTLEEISAKTRINLRNLQAIETDDPSLFTSAFFYRSFVRQFAQQVGIEFTDLAAAVTSFTSSMPEPLIPGQTELASPLPKVPALRPSRRKKLRWLYSFTSLIVMLVGCSTVNSLWQDSRPHLETAFAGLTNLLALHGREHSAPPGHNVRVALKTMPSRGAVRPAAPAAITPLIPNGE